MKTRTLKAIERTYKNNGIHAEQTYEFAVLGTISKHNNKPFWCGGDVGDVQVKSAKATVCNGTNIMEHIAKDKATSYAYVISNFEMAYEMNPTEWIEFVNEFGYITTESEKNGGAKKIRLKSESKKMMEWLATKC